MGRDSKVFNVKHDLEPGAWFGSAACRGTETDMYVEANVPYENPELLAALRICGQCGVKRDCLEFAIENREAYGVWGGTTEYQRRQLIRSSVTTPIDVVMKDWAVAEVKAWERVEMKLNRIAEIRERDKVKGIPRKRRAVEAEKTSKKQSTKTP